MKTIKELKKSEGSLIENATEIIENMISENGWGKTFVPEVLSMSDELKMSVINTYEHMVFRNRKALSKTANSGKIAEIRAALDGIIIPHI